jgi:hypothetical protein
MSTSRTYLFLHKCQECHQGEEAEVGRHPQLLSLGGGVLVVCQMLAAWLLICCGQHGSIGSITTGLVVCKLLRATRRTFEA